MMILVFFLYLFLEDLLPLHPPKVAHEDVCDLSLIYNDEFRYSLPEEILKSYLEGDSFGKPSPYTEEESARLHSDIQRIYNAILTLRPCKRKLAVITAGAPGAGKTILMRQKLTEESLLGRRYAYIDPDDVCLKNMQDSWGAEVGNDRESRKMCYDKWRPGSNAANHLILANLVRQNFGLYIGTTSTSPQAGKLYGWLKERGYQIHLLHVIAPDQVRWESIVERDRTFVQTTEEDVVEKGKLLPQRIGDTYLRYADRIDFYYRDAVHGDAKLVCTWIPGELTVVDEKLYEVMVALHNDKCTKEQDLWENSVMK